MGVRSHVQLTVEVGDQGTLDDLIFGRSLEEMLDTIEDAVSATGQLAGGEASRQIDLGDIQEVHLLYIEADAEIEVYFGGSLATAASITGVAGTFPTTFVGGETFIVTVDGVAVTTTFTVAAQSNQDCVNEINAAAALLGIAPIASVVSGQIVITSPTLGSSSTLLIGAGTGNAVLGFTSSATDTGVDSIPSTSPHRLQRMATPTGSTASTLKAYMLATLKATAIYLTNPDATNAVRYRLMAAGDLVTA